MNRVLEQENKKTSKPKIKMKFIILMVLITIAIIFLGFVFCDYLNKNKNEQIKPEFENEQTNPKFENNQNNPEFENEQIKPEFDNEQLIAELEEYLKENYNKFIIDGSTTMIPLHEVLEKEFGNGQKIQHSKTVSSFENFIDGKIDILLAVDYTDEYFDQAKNKNVEINKKKITKEALVFLKNINTKIDSLTLEQISKIYNGKTFKFSDLNNEISEEEDFIINPIYRNEDSGSGMAFVKKFGKVTRDCEKNQCLFISSMTSIVNALTDGMPYIESMHDNKYSYGPTIAYNMYTFTEKQYHSKYVTNIKINGVEPTDETIYTGEYPLALYNYIYYKNDKAKEFGENLYKYLISYKGQKMLKENGYIPLRKIDDSTVKNQNRDCEGYFIEEVCVTGKGYNKTLDKYIKINMESETCEYFDKLDDYIFANSNLSKEEEQKIREIFSDFLNEVIERKDEMVAENITFEKQDNGEIILSVGPCGGAPCLGFVTQKDYKFKNPNINSEENLLNKYSNVYTELHISNDFQTLHNNREKDKKDYIEIPSKDILKAFWISDK